MRYLVWQNEDWVEVSAEEYQRSLREGGRVYFDDSPTLQEPMPEGWTPPPVAPRPVEPPPDNTPTLMEPMPEGWTPPSSEPPPPGQLGKFQDEGTKITDYFGCAPRVAVLIAFLIMVLIAAWFGLDLGGGDSKCPKAAPRSGELLLAAADDCATDTTPAPVSETTDGAGSANGAAPPNQADLPEGVMLFQGSSGDPIGCIACDGQSRFLSLERRGVGVGNASSGEFDTAWELEGQVLEFGARITAPNKGRYGVNLWIDGATYGPGVALEIGEQSAVYKWTPERDGTIRSGHQMAIIVGEAGIVDDDGVPVAQGDYQLEWWFTFRPA